MRYAKAFVAVATAALLAAQTAVPLSTGAHGWVTVLLAALGAAAVYAVPNEPMPAPLPAAPEPPRTAFTVAPPVPGRYPPPKE